MLQKIFQRGRNSFHRRSSAKNESSTAKNESSTATKKTKLFHSKSLDDSTTTVSKNQNTSTSPSPKSTDKSSTVGRTANGEATKRAPLAGKEDSFDGGDSARKVHFRDTTSPEGVINNIEHEALFDDGVLREFEVGNLSIQEFLESPQTSPETTPDTTLVKKTNKTTVDNTKPSVENSSTPRSLSLPASPMKRPSLLDQAHAKAGHNTARLPASPALRKQIRLRRASTETAEPNRKKNHRFSKSLEHLAQQVFGEAEFEKQLEKASEETAKIPLVASTVIVSDAKHSSNNHPKEINEQQLVVNELKSVVAHISRSKSLSPRSAARYVKQQQQQQENTASPLLVCPKSEPINRKKAGVADARTTTIRKTIHRSHSAIQKNEVSLQHLNQAPASMTRSVDFPTPTANGNNNNGNEPDKLESWCNKMDLSSSRTSSLGGGGEALGVGCARMDPVIEDVLLNSPQKDRQRTKSEGSVGNTTLNHFQQQQQLFGFDRHQHQRGRLAKSDSTAATCGSDLDLSASETSILDINFPPPPPPPPAIEETIDPIKTEIQEQCLPFDWEIVSSDGGEGVGEHILSQDLGDPTVDVTSSRPDPLVETLLSVVPLPEDPAQLTPALSRALSEIVSEIISARHKLTRILKAIEIHQHILKDQTKQIATQSQQISQLRFTQWEINATTAATQNATVKLRQNKQNKVRRPQSARTYRQSREMVEINNTLDNLLHQCSTMKLGRPCCMPSKESRDDNSVKRSPSGGVKRSNTFPSREHVPTLKRIESHD